MVKNFKNGFVFRSGMIPQNKFQTEVGVKELEHDIQVATAQQLLKWTNLKNLKLTNVQIGKSTLNAAK